jgi:(p)ppGpp synthase/HD superfamily hydrolase
MDLCENAVAILEDLGADRECIAAARARGGSADARAAAVRRALGVRWFAGGRVPAAHAIEAIAVIAGDGRAILLAAASVLAHLRATGGADAAEARAALSVWAPLAARFGLAPLQREIEDRAFKDYVARPKPSGYRSLHTCVHMVGAVDRPVEIQIRSRAMHASAEHGTASHLRYKNQDWTEPDAGRWRYVLTPQGEVRRLPSGATPLDFAYAIHTEIGHRYMGARVMGRMVSADTPLNNGDVVEILHSARMRPSVGQLARVRTARARNRIRAALATRAAP